MFSTNSQTLKPQTISVKSGGATGSTIKKNSFHGMMPISNSTPRRLPIPSAKLRSMPRNQVLATRERIPTGSLNMKFMNHGSHVQNFYANSSDTTKTLQKQNQLQKPKASALGISKSQIIAQAKPPQQMGMLSHRRSILAQQKSNLGPSQIGNRFGIQLGMQTFRSNQFQMNATPKIHEERQAYDGVDIWHESHADSDYYPYLEINEKEYQDNLNDFMDQHFSEIKPQSVESAVTEQPMKISYKDLTKALSQWQFQMKKMISEEPLLQEFQQFKQNQSYIDWYKVWVQAQAKANEGVINLQVYNSNFNEETEWMSEEDLKLVTNAMAMDLSTIIDWYKDPEAIDKYGQPLPEHHMHENRGYWLNVSKQIFYVGNPCYITEIKDKGHNQKFTIELALENFYLNSEFNIQKVIQEDQALLRKLSFVAHNFQEIKQFMTAPEKVRYGTEFGYFATMTKIKQQQERMDKLNEICQLEPQQEAKTEADQGSDSKNEYQSDDQQFTLVCDDTPGSICQFKFKDTHVKVDDLEKDSVIKPQEQSPLSSDLLQNILTRSSDATLNTVLNQTKGKRDNVQYDVNKEALEVLYNNNSFDEQDLRQLDQDLLDYEEEQWNAYRSQEETSCYKNQVNIQTDTLFTTLFSADSKMAQESSEQSDFDKEEELWNKYRVEHCPPSTRKDLRTLCSKDSALIKSSLVETNNNSTRPYSQRLVSY